MKNKIENYKKNIIKIMSVFFVIFPWITYLKLVEYSQAESQVFGGTQGYDTDFFLYYKEVFLIAMAAFFICWFIGERIFPEKVDNDFPLFKGKNKTLFIFVGVFVIMTVLATILSDNKSTAMLGSPTEREGLWVLIAYVVLVLGYYNYFSNEYAVKLMKRAVVCVAAAIVVLSLVEYFYKPLLEIGIVQKLIGTSEYEELLHSIQSDGFEDTVSLTFYNPSYYGGFVCLFIPFVLSFVMGARNKKESIINVVVLAGLYFGVIVSNSTTALYIAIAESVLVIILYIIKSADKKKAFINVVAVVLSMAVLVIGYSVLSDNSIINILKNENSATGKTYDDRYVIEDIVLEENSVCIKGENNSVKVIYSDGQIELFDESNKKLDTKFEDNVVSFKDEEYKDLSLKLVLNDTAVMGILAKIVVDAGYDDTIDFYILSDGKMSGIGQNNSIVEDIGNAGISTELEKYYGMFTGRGYAWSNSLPILAKTAIIGVGPGNFAFHFKQNDYVGMLNTHGSTKYIIDKPHNAYIQMGINVGIVGMIAFFGTIVLAVIKAVKVYKNSKNVEKEGHLMLIGGLTAIIGFLIYSIINDSIVTVTPQVCMIAGVVMSVSYMFSKGD